MFMGFIAMLIAVSFSLSACGNPDPTGENKPDSETGNFQIGDEIPDEITVDMRKFTCARCGYVYDPAANRNVSFTELAVDWKCPQCGAPKSIFVAPEE